MQKLKILFLSPRLPFPLIGGDRVKSYHLLKYLASKHEVHLVSFYQGKANPQPYIDELKKLGIDIHIVHLNPIKAGLNCFKTFTSRLPLEILYYYSDEFQQVVNKIFNANKIDLAFSFFMRTALYIKDFDVKKILIAEDCRTVYQNRSFNETHDIAQKAIRWWEWRKLEKFEPEILNHFDKVTLVSANDIKYMKELNPKPNYSLLTNGTDISIFKRNGMPKEKYVLFAGKLDIHANQIMIEKIVNQIFPKILLKHNDYKLKIVGANPSSSILKLASANIEVIPNVPSMISYLQSASIFIHPHSGGSGIQNKLIEAMACGCPVVTTETGNQGINGTSNKNLIIANSIDEFVLSCCKIIEDKNLADEISKNAAEHIINTLSWERVYKDLEKIIEEVI